jgi:hypothetical protein
VGALRQLTTAEGAAGVYSAGKCQVASSAFLLRLRGYGFKGMGCGSHVGGAVSKREFDLRPSTVDNIGKSTAGTAGVRPSKRPVPITRANASGQSQPSTGRLLYLQIRHSQVGAACPLWANSTDITASLRVARFTSNCRHYISTMPHSRSRTSAGIRLQDQPCLNTDGPQKSRDHVKMQS